MLLVISIYENVYWRCTFVYPGIEDGQLARKSVGSQFVVFTHPHAHVFFPVALRKGFLRSSIVWLPWSDWMFLARSPAKRRIHFFREKSTWKINPGMRNFANLDAVPAGLRRPNGCPILRIPFRPFPQLPFQRLGTSALTPNSAWDLRVARWTGWTTWVWMAFFQPTETNFMPCPALVPQLSPTEPPSHPPSKKKKATGSGTVGVGP